MQTLLSSYWDPQRNLFTIPFINLPIGWYGLLFVTGIILSYWIVLFIMRTLLLERHQCKAQEDVISIAISLTYRFVTWFVVLRIILGARLGHVFFYDWPYFSIYLGKFLTYPRGVLTGLASHGGAIGILLAILLFRLTIRKKFPELTFWRIVDTVAVPTALAWELLYV